MINMVMRIMMINMVMSIMMINMVMRFFVKLSSFLVMSSFKHLHQVVINQMQNEYW